MNAIPQTAGRNTPQGAPPMNIMAIAPKKTTHDDDIKFTVRDQTATVGPRTHIMLDENGKQVPFTFVDQYTPVPIAYRFAVKFAAIQEFEVKDSAGRFIIASRDERREANGIQLKDSECIAALTELTQGALITRAERAGGKFKSNAGKAEIVDFLTSMAGLKIVSQEEKDEAARRAMLAASDDDAQERTPAGDGQPGDGALEVEMEE